MTKQLTKLFALVLLFSSTAFGQGKYDFLRLGDKEFAKKNYFTASQYYLRVFDQYSDSSTKAYPYSRFTTLNTTKYIDQYYEVMYKLAESYRLYNDYNNAEKWYSKVGLLAPQQFPLSKLWYGVSLRANGKYDEALNQLTAFRSIYNQKDEYARTADLEIQKCKYAKEAVRMESNVEVTRLDSLGLNTRGSNFGAAISVNDSSIYFTSSRRLTASSVAAQNLAPISAVIPETGSVDQQPNANPGQDNMIDAQTMGKGDSLSVSTAPDNVSGKKSGKKGKKSKNAEVTAGDSTSTAAAPSKKKSKKKKGKKEEYIQALQIDTLSGDTTYVNPTPVKLQTTTEVVPTQESPDGPLSVQFAPKEVQDELSAKEMKKQRKSKGSKVDSLDRASAKAPKKKRKPYNPGMYDDEEFFNQLYRTNRNDSSEWTIPQLVLFEEQSKKSKKNDGYNVGTPSFTQDRKTMYFTRWSGQDKKKPVFNIYKSSQYESGLWSIPVKLKEPMNMPNVKYMHPNVSPDGKRLYFVSDKTGGIGALDIWYTDIDTAGNFSQPVNAGAKINTKDNDESPFYAAGEKALYFASAGRLGMGGLDVFRASYKEGAIDTAMNMGYPVNSSRDDAYLVAMNNDTTRGYMSSDRLSDCCYELYEYNYIYGTIRGRIMDNETKLPVVGIPVRLIDEGLGKEVARMMTDADGYYYFRVAPNKTYKILAGSDNQLKDSRRVSTKGLKDNQLINLPNIDLNKLVLDKPIEIRNIYYDFNKATLRPESEQVLDTLANFLAENPDVVVEIGSHTDNVGSDSFNQDLSNRRSEVVVNYLIYKGIPARLLRFKGYGEAMPIAANVNADGSDNPAGRQLNRRTEFKVLQILR